MSPRFGQHPLREAAARGLASAFLSGPWRLPLLLVRADVALGTGGAWLWQIASDVVRAFPVAPRHAPEKVALFIRHHIEFLRAWRVGLFPHRVPRPVLTSPEMGPRRWPVPALGTLADLAQWLELDHGQLGWFADQRAMLRSAASPMQHYCFTWLARGERVGRLLEAPKPRLKALQRRLLDGLLSHVPTHPAAHGFVRGRSVLSHAALHAGQPQVMRFDLRTFFTSITARRAHGLFVALGYPIAVVRALVGLCTTRTPERVLREAPYPVPFDTAAGLARFSHVQMLRASHLPQGAPTSPALANLAAFGLDVRLSALAERLELRYSRYADDLVFSGALRSPGALHEQVRAIARDEGFALNDDKTRLMPSHARQSVTGIVVNERPNFSRTDFDVLKATLHRCLTRGVPAEGREPGEVRAELQGRIAWVRQLNPGRAERLQKTFDQIVWNAQG